LRIIDFHTHFFPDKVAEKAVSKLEGTSGCRAYSDGTQAGLVASMARAGIERSVVLPVATNPEKVSSVNQFSASVTDPRLCMLGGLHPLSPLWREHLEEMIGLGLPGVKFHPDYQEFEPDDPQFLPLFAALRDSGLPVVFHAGEDLSFPPPNLGTPASFSNLLDKLPGLKLVATHMGGFRMWDEVERCLIGRPVYMDTSFGFGWMSDERIRSMIGRHGDDYVLFGTDSPWLDQPAEVQNVLRLGLGGAAEEKIFFRNAIRLIPSLAQ
jgi:uncharacterized protein